MTIKEIQFLKANVQGTSLKELTRMYNEFFGTNKAEATIKGYKIKLGLKSGVDSRFKKGDKPHNKKKIGYEFIDTNGYTYIKIEEPNTWVQKQRYVYEQHYGKIEDGYSIIFLDEDKTNFEIDNLKKVRDKDKLVAKNLHLFSNSKELTEIGLLIAQIINTISEKRKEL